MTERPILFSAPLVRAILDGRKVVTRRPVKNVQFIGGRGQEDDPSAWGFGDQYGCWHVLDQTAQPWYGSGVTHESYRIACPYGQAGDRLWVRESSWLLGISDGEPRVVGPDAPGEPGDPPRVWYAADGERPALPQYPPWCWLRRNSIHMPRWASRITLEVTSVGVERLQDITEEDARAEGVTVGAPVPAIIRVTQDGKTTEKLGSCVDFTARGSFAHAWDSIYGAGPWATNPWVWVVRFRRER